MLVEDRLLVHQALHLLGVLADPVLELKFSLLMGIVGVHVIYVLLDYWGHFAFHYRGLLLRDCERVRLAD